MDGLYNNAAEDIEDNGFDADDLVDDGYVEDLDGGENLERGEMALTPGEYFAYRQEWESRRLAYLIMKDDFLFNVKMAFYTADAFDWGLLPYAEYRSRIQSRVIHCDRYRNDFNVPFVSFVLIARALIGDIPWNEHIYSMYCSLHLIVFPQ